MHIECLASDPWKSADKNTVCVSVHLLVCVRVCMRDENAKDNSDSKANDTTRNKNKQTKKAIVGRGGVIFACRSLSVTTNIKRSAHVESKLYNGII